MHTRLLVRAQEWERKERDDSYLLRGMDLQEAEGWLAEAVTHPTRQPTAGHIEYLQESQAVQRQEMERLRELYAKATARQLATQVELLRHHQPHLLVRSVLLATESMRRYPSLEADQPLRQGLALLPRPIAQVVHARMVTAVAFSPDGRRFATASDDCTAAIWEVSGTQVARLEHNQRVNALQFTPDGQLLITASDDGTARVWRADAGACVAVLVHGSAISHLAVHPEGTLAGAACGTYSQPDNDARIWDLVSGAEVLRLEHDGRVRTVTFSPSGALIATGSTDHTVRLWDVRSGKEIARMLHDSEVYTVAFSAGGRFLASSSHDLSMRIWDVATEKETVRVSDLDSELTSLAFNADGRYLASGSYDDTARVWDTATGKELLCLHHGSTVQSIAFAPHHLYLLTASSDGTTRVWDLVRGEEIAHMCHEGGCYEARFSSDGRYVVTGRHDQTARVWEALTPNIPPMTHTSWITSLALDTEGNYLAPASNGATTDHYAKIWDAKTGTLCAVLDHGEEADVRAVAFSPDGSLLATGCGAISSPAADPMCNAVRVWEVPSGKTLLSVPQPSLVMDVAFSPDGGYLAAASTDCTVWGVADGKQIVQLPHGRGVNVVVFSQDGNLIASGGADTVCVWDMTAAEEKLRIAPNALVNDIAWNLEETWIVVALGATARIWRLADGEEIFCGQHGDAVQSVAVSPDGYYLATASFDNTAKLWHVVTGELIHTMQHERGFLSVAFSPDGNCLATGGMDYTARIWDVSRGLELARVNHGFDVWQVAFTPDGKRLASASADGSARLSLWRPEDLIAQACECLPRNLTADEWRLYLSDEPYRQTCGG
jgi:WD40 repeat protein